MSDQPISQANWNAAVEAYLQACQTTAELVRRHRIEREQAEEDLERALDALVAQEASPGIPAYLMTAEDQLADQRPALTIVRGPGDLADTAAEDQAEADDLAEGWPGTGQGDRVQEVEDRLFGRYDRAISPWGSDV